MQFILELYFWSHITNKKAIKPGMAFGFSLSAKLVLCTFQLHIEGEIGTSQILQYGLCLYVP